MPLQRLPPIGGTGSLAATPYSGFLTSHNTVVAATDVPNELKMRGPK